MASSSSIRIIGLRLDFCVGNGSSKDVRSIQGGEDYLLTGEQFQDEYKGEVNHLAYNSKRGHLPPLEQTENLILHVGLDIHAKTGGAPEWVIAYWDWYRKAVLGHVKHLVNKLKCGTPFRKRKQNDNQE